MSVPFQYFFRNSNRFYFAGLLSVSGLYAFESFALFYSGRVGYELCKIGQKIGMKT